MNGSGIAALSSALAAGLAFAATPEKKLDFTELFPEEVKCVYLVAPASQLDTSTVAAFTNALAEAGIRTKVSKGVWKYEADAAKRARHLEEAWADPEADLILCTRGGKGSFETLLKLDLGKLRAREIPFMGFSNISVLLNAFVAKGVGRPISGPTVSSLANYPNTPDAVRRVRDTLAFRDLPSAQLAVYRAPAAAVMGKPLGGHFPSLAKMTSEWLPDSTGRVIFLEVNKTYVFEKAVERFDALKATGWFDNAAAIVLCDIGISGPEEQREKLRRHIADSVACPVFSGYSHGHIPDLFAIDFNRVLTITPEGVLSWGAASPGTRAGNDDFFARNLPEAAPWEWSLQSGEEAVMLSGTNDQISVIAQRSGDSWCVVGRAATAQSFALRTKFLGAGGWQAEIYRPGTNGFAHEFRQLGADAKIDFTLAAGDRFAVRFLGRAWPKFNESWWADRFKANLRQIAESNGEIDLVFLGDSITHYWDVGEGSDTSTEIVELRKKYSILSAGYGGDWCQNVLWRVENGELDGYSAKLVMLTIGTNNFGTDVTPERVVARTREIVAAIRRKQPGAKILLLPIFPRGDSYGGGLKKAEELLFASDFDDHVIRFSFNDKMVDADGKVIQDYFEDSLHPSAKGYELWRREVEPIFRQVVGR